MRTARVASLVAFVVGIVLGVFILFGPTYYGCSVGASGKRLSVAWNSWLRLLSDVAMSQ